MQWIRTWSLATRMLILVAIALCAIFAVVISSSARALEESTERVYAERLQAAQSIALYVDRNVAYTLDQLRRGSEFRGFDLADTNPEPERESLTQLVKSSFPSYVLFTTNGLGQVQSIQPAAVGWVGMDLSRQQAVQAALSTGKPQVSSLASDPTSSKNLVWFLVPVKDSSGNIAGLIGAAHDPSLKTLSAWLPPPNVTSPNIHFQLADAGGSVVASDDGQATGPVLPASDWARIAGDKQKPSVTTAIVQDKAQASVNSIIAYAPLEFAPWAVVLEQPQADALAPISNFQHSLVLIGALAFLVILAVTLAGARSVVMPLQELLVASRRIGAGDLATPVQVTGHDEISQLGDALEGMRSKLAAWGDDLDGAVQKRTRELTILYTIDRAAAQSLDLDEVLKNALTKVSQLLRADAAAIFLLEPDGETLKLCVHRGLPDDLIANIGTLSARDGLVAQAIDRQTPFTYRSVDFKRGRMSPYLIREGLSILASIPLVSNSVCTGVLHFGMRQSRMFPPEEIELLTSIGRQLGSAVHNSRLFAQTQKNLSRMTDLYELGTEIISAQSVRETAETIGRRVVQAARAHSVVITLVDNDGKITLDTGVSRDGPWGLESRPRTQGATRWILESGEPLIIPSPEVNSDLIQPQLFSAGVMALIGLPLQIGSRITGVLFIRHSEPHRFGEDEVQALTIYANQAATALERARLHEETQHRAEHLAVLNRIGRAAGASLNIDELLQIAQPEITAVIPADIFFIALYDREREELDYRIRLVNGVPQPAVRVARATGLTGKIIAEERPVLLNQPPAEALAPELRAFDLTETPQSWLGVPLLVGEQVKGVVSVQTYAPNAYSNDEQELLTTIADQLAIAIENARLYEVEHRRAAQLGKILKLSTEMATAPDERTLGQRIVVRGREIAASETCAMLLIDSGSKQAMLAAQSGLSEEFPLGTLYALASPAIRQSLDVGQPFQVTDVQRDAPELRALASQGGQSSLFALPMMREGRCLGLITFSNVVPNVPSREEMMTFQLLAERAASALEIVRLNQETRQRLAELAALFEVSSSLRGLPNVESMPRVILRKALEVVHAETGSLSLVERDRVVCRAAIGERQVLIGKSVAIGEGITGRVAATGEIYTSSDAAQESDLIVRPEWGSGLDKAACNVCVPLKAADQVIGVMHVSSFSRHAFTDSQVHLLSAIADMAASAIHRSGLFEELEDRVQELGTLFEVGKAVTSSLRLQDVLTLVAQVAPRAVDAEGCFVFLWDEVENHLILRAAAGMGDAVNDIKYRRDEGLAGRVFVENRLANVPDLDLSNDWERHPEIEKALASGFAHSALVVPLTMGDKTLGVIGVVNKVGAPAFTTGDESLLTALAGQIAIAIDNARLYEDVRDLSIATIRSLAAAIDARDSYTRGHSDDVAKLSVQLAQALGWQSNDLEKIEFAALLHDVGKIAVPDAVLHNEGELTADEWNIVHMHPYHSAQIIKPVHSLRGIIPWIYHHQERWDGTGYPDRLKEEAIPLASRIIAVVDAYNAMTTDRPYRKALTQKAAIDELERMAGTQFDPNIVATFLNIVSRS